MKKILALMLAGCPALSMAACGGENSQQQKRAKPKLPSLQLPRRKKLRTKPAKTLRKSKQKYRLAVK